MKRRLLFVAVVLLALVVRAQYGEPPSRRRYAEGKWSGDGWLLERPGAVPILFMSGTPEEMGRQHGALLKNLIATTYSRILLVAGGYLYLKDDRFFDCIEEVERRVAKTLKLPMARNGGLW